MALTITDHGTWSRYTPDTPPITGAPANALWHRRDSDQVDWYLFLKQNPFSPTSLKMTVRQASGKWSVINQVTEADRLVPENVRVIEVSGFDPGEVFIGSPYDPITKTIDSLQAAKDTKTTALQVACNNAISGGYTSSALGDPHTYASDATSQMNMIASVMSSMLPAAAADPNWKTQFWCADAGGTKSFVDHTAAQIQQAGTDGKAAVIAAHNKLNDLTAQVAAAITISQVNSISW